MYGCPVEHAAVLTPEEVPPDVAPRAVEEHATKSGTATVKRDKREEIAGFILDR